MDKLQIFFFFISGFLVSRLIIKVGLPALVVSYAIGKKKVSLTRLSFYLIAISALISLFVPNVITVLTMLPILELLRKTFERNAYGKGIHVPTLLALTVIYGANIGGMGTITGTPSNGILVAYLAANAIPGSESVQYVTWLLWGIPLVACMTILAWAVLLIVMRPWRLPYTPVELHLPRDVSWSRKQKTALKMTLLYFVSSSLLSMLLLSYRESVLPVLGVTLIFTIVFGLFLFVPIFVDNDSGKRKALLTIADCYSNLPTRGFFFVAIAVVLTGLLYVLKVHILFSHWIEAILPAGVPHVAYFFLISLITSFSTEVLSNTAAQISMFMLALPLSAVIGFSPLNILIVITLSCTCAFMSPIATGVNGLAFGSIKGVSIKRMAGAGVLLNMISVSIIALFGTYFLPL